mmetsp:Transcript_5334/g.18521  ORF Transcript_5334/g.18521 Transcript_5334/m.18521 type:complete len:274 (-) Transcript_5334:477-1298(-)
MGTATACRGLCRRWRGRSCRVECCLCTGRTRLRSRRRGASSLHPSRVSLARTAGRSRWTRWRCASASRLWSQSSRARADPRRARKGRARRLIARRLSVTRTRRSGRSTSTRASRPKPSSSRATTFRCRCCKRTCTTRRRWSASSGQPTRSGSSRARSSCPSRSSATARTTLGGGSSANASSECICACTNRCRKGRGASAGQKCRNRSSSSALRTPSPPRAGTLRTRRRTFLPRMTNGRATPHTPTLASTAFTWFGWTGLLLVRTGTGAQRRRF